MDLRYVGYGNASAFVNIACVKNKIIGHIKLGNVNLGKCCVYNGRLYFNIKPMEVLEKETAEMFSLGLDSFELAQEPDLPKNINDFNFVQSNGKLYVIHGTDADESIPSSERILNSVFCFDGEKWEQKDDITYIGRITDNHGNVCHTNAIAKADNGLVFIDSSVDGAGNVFLYDTVREQLIPLYYTTVDSLTDSFDQDKLSDRHTSSVRPSLCSCSCRAFRSA